MYDAGQEATDMELSGYGYVCAAGETFDGVALTVYGDEQYAAELLCANPEHCHTVVFSGGERLYLPVVEILDDETAEDYSGAPTPAPWKE